MIRLLNFFHKHSFFLLLVYCGILAILYSTLSILRHNHFQSGAFDLGLYDQAVWKFGHLLGPYNTVKDRIIFGDHFVLTLPIFGILFYLWDNVRILLIVQAIAIATSVIPIFLIARKRLESSFSAFCVAIIYSLFYGIQYGVYFDFHPIIIGVAVLSWLAYFWEYDKKFLFWITFFVGLATQENMGIAIAGLAAIFFFRKKYWKTAIIVGILGLAYSLLSTKVAAMFSPIGYQYWPQLPTTLVDAFARLFDSEEKRQVWLYSYSTFSFLPLLSPGSLIAVLMDLSQYFVTGPEFSRMWSPFMHHRAILAPFLVLGTIDVLSVLKKVKLRVVYVAAFLLIVSLILQYVFHFPLNKLTKSEYWKEEPWMQDTRQLIERVPRNASIAAQQNLVPHLSHRKEIYLVWPREHDIDEMPCGQKLCWWLDFGVTAEYLVVDTRPGQWLTQILETNEHWNSAIANMEKAGRIQLEKQVGGARLYKILKLK
ncbi:MAG: DUF2079 domain-containing protein [Candidatus Gottesmanbacteria bacterium]